jgi:hypothetical protein
MGGWPVDTSSLAPNRHPWACRFGLSPLRGISKPDFKPFSKDLHKLENIIPHIPSLLLWQHNKLRIGHLVQCKAI